MHTSLQQMVTLAIAVLSLCPFQLNQAQVLSDEQLDTYALGQSFVSKPWVAAPAATTARDGLGPLYNANTCLSCHPKQGRGNTLLNNDHIDRSLLLKTSNPVTRVDPVYGDQININAIHGVKFEATPKVQFKTIAFTYPDESTVALKQPVFSLTNLQYGPLHPQTTLLPRLAPALFGLGLLESIPDNLILQRSDPNDLNQDGISGRPHWVNVNSTRKLGRFNWKASATSIQQQITLALSHDMGLTSPDLANENCTKPQIKCKNAPKGSALDISRERIQAMSFYISQQAVPKPTTQQPSALGQQHFVTFGCNLCHTSQYQLSESVIIKPYSDLLLHDMGPDLSDKHSKADSMNNEWRTPPLWGIGQAKVLNKKAGFLHDGRAATLEHAILWHGGEATKAKQAFIQGTKAQRNQLIQFLRSL
ncbi:MAG: hypothetical protein HOM11_02310 [Methylococcales bacterium]|jgi:CxxC motif-containing protein (DUF1111 family)|nr:hypothetical protein [Methylococcales bacterium]MBT7444896.1 hypothetical protein [Methylococcales bacterium]